MKIIFLFSAFILLILFSCRQETSYDMNDFARVEKTDAHYHIYTGEENSVEQAQNDNFRLININTYSGGCERVVDAHQNLKALQQQYPGTTAYTATFCLDGWDEPGWVENTIAWIDQSIADGAIAVKVWK
ncbi:MAG: hypothetical protein ACOC0R_06400, partial [Mariniphaga sp.]